MTINPISNTPDIQKIERDTPLKRIEHNAIPKDKIEISSHAKESHQLRLYAGEMTKKIANTTPDVRMELVARAAIRLKTGVYNQPNVTEEIAKRLSKIIGLEV
ncbi:flagellar biosynthesis anti-sigma factor FlgM [bacterium]|nr:flagellar biosynthesis anti-sigma factor FlgM [bacterium]MBU1752691.1 flagellar biosynthesis anti-sigma factor FlgM [bacterium]